MADNFDFTPGVGKTAGSDEISSVHYPRHKLIHGADGVNAGDVSGANGLPVAPAQASQYEAMSVKAYTVLTDSHTNMSLSNVSTARYLYVWNDTDSNVYISFDNGGNTHACVPTRAARMIRIKAGATNVYAKRASSNSTGNCFFEVIA